MFDVYLIHSVLISLNDHFIFQNVSKNKQAHHVMSVRFFWGVYCTHKQLKKGKKIINKALVSTLKKMIFTPGFTD